MDLDLTQLRAFVVTADELHFTRAAARLFLTQQALSKRIRRLEATLGEPLFARGSSGVELTEAGRRFLPDARRLLADTDAAVAAIRRTPRPLRVDVSGHLWPPHQLVRRLASEHPELLVELSMRRSMGAALEALQRNQIDAGFGRVHDLGVPWPAELAHRPVVLQRLAVVVSADHPLAELSRLAVDDLRRSVLWLPGGGSPPELIGLYRRFADHLGIALDTAGSNLGLDLAVAQLRRDPPRCMLLSADWTIPANTNARLIPVNPAPCYAWSLAWREDDRHPLLRLLLRLTAQTEQQDRWLGYDPDHHWLPEIDLAELRHEPGGRKGGPQSFQG
jgi:DNA-binding transcriptional LysR family regulator